MYFPDAAADVKVLSAPFSCLHTHVEWSFSKTYMSFSYIDSLGLHTVEEMLQEMCVSLVDNGRTFLRHENVLLNLLTQVNIPRAARSLLAYKLKQIPFSMLYHLPCY